MANPFDQFDAAQPVPVALNPRNVGGLNERGKIVYGKLSDTEMLDVLKSQLSDPDRNPESEPELRREISRLEKRRGVAVNPFDQFEMKSVPTANVKNPFDEFDGQEPAQIESQPVKDLAKSAASGVVSGTSATIRGAGETMREGGNLLAKGINAIAGTELSSVNPLAGVSDWMDAKAKAIASSRSVAAQNAEQQSTPRGDLIDAIIHGDFSKVDLGENPSFEGYANLATNVFGQMVPIVLGTALTRSPVAAARAGAVLGGAQGGGAAAQQARDAILGMKPEDLAQVPLYKQLLAQGTPPENAKQQTAAAASRMAFLLTTPVSALGGAATGAITKGTVGKVLGGGVAGKVAAVPISMGEEAVQETAEQVTQNLGQNIATGTQVPLGEGSMANAVLGAVGGAGPAAVGAAHSNAAPQAQPQPQQGIVLDVGGGRQVANTEELQRFFAPLGHNERLPALMAALKLDVNDQNDNAAIAALHEVFAAHPQSEVAKVIGEQLWPNAAPAAQEAASAAQEEAMAPPAEAAPVPAKVLVRAAKKRLDEIHTKGYEAAPQLERIDETGKAVYRPGHRQFLTDAEKDEYAFLSENIDNPVALAQRYGVELAPETPSKQRAAAQSQTQESAVADDKTKVQPKPKQSAAAAVAEMPKGTDALRAARGASTIADTVASNQKKAEREIAQAQAVQEKPVSTEREQAQNVNAAAPHAQPPAVPREAATPAVAAATPAKEVSKKGTPRPEAKLSKEASKAASEKPQSTPKNVKPEAPPKNAKVVNPESKVVKALGPKGEEAVAKSKAKERSQNENNRSQIENASPSKVEKALLKEVRDVLKKNPGTTTPVAIVRKELGLPDDVARDLVARVGKPTPTAKPAAKKGALSKAEQDELQSELNDEQNPADLSRAPARQEPRAEGRPSAAGTDSEAGAVLRSAVAQYYRDAPTSAVLDVVRANSTDARLAQEVVKKFGYKLSFFQNHRPDLFDFEGVAPRDSKHVFVNANHRMPVMSVVGHELLHKLRQSSEQQYQSLLTSLRAYFDKAGKKQHRDDLVEQIRKEGSQLLNEHKLEEEFIADSVGEAFLDPAFWEMLSQNQPMLFQRVVDIVLKFFNSMLDFSQGHAHSQFFTDALAAREVIANAMGDWAASQIATSDDYRGTLHRGTQSTLSKRTFQRERLGGSSGRAPSGLGVFFTTSHENASNYGNVESFNVTLKKPFRVKVDDLPIFETIDDAFAYREKLRADGHDGIIIESRHLGSGYDHVVVFSPESVEFSRFLETSPDEYRRRYSAALAESRDNLRHANAREVFVAKMPQNISGARLKGEKQITSPVLRGAFANIRQAGRLGSVPDEILTQLPERLSAAKQMYKVSGSLRVIIGQHAGKDVVVRIADRQAGAEIAGVELQRHEQAVSWSRAGLQVKSPTAVPTQKAGVREGVEHRAEPAGNTASETVAEEGEKDNSPDFARLTPRQRMALGQQVNGLFSQAAQEYTADPNKIRKLQVPQAQRALDSMNNWIGHYMDALGKLPEEASYLVQRNVAMGLIAQSNEMAEKVYRVFNKATDAEAKQVYDYWTTPYSAAGSITNPELRQEAVETKALIEQIGEKLVHRGLLERETFEANKGKYLPRLYLKHLLEEGDWRAIGTGKKPSDLGYLKRRHDIPDDIRKAILGEITAPGYLGAMAVGRPLRDLALMDFLHQISQNEEWIWKPSITVHKGQRVSVKWVANEISRLREQVKLFKDPQIIARATQEITDLEQTLTQATVAQAGQRHPDDFKEIPDLPRYGLLRGMLVRGEIYDDLIGSAHINPSGHGWAEHFFGYGGTSTKAVNMWKTAKVALNPPGQIRNFISNMILLHLSGVPMHLIPVRMAQAMKSMRTKDRFYQAAMRYGISIGTFSAHELYRIETEFLADKGEGGPFAFLRYVKLLASKAGDLYQLMESVGKIAKMIDEIERRGASEPTAAIEANKWLFDYSLVPPSVRYLRNAPVGAPFVTFYYKLAPRLLEVAAKYPWRFAPYVGLAYILPQLVAGSLGVGPDDLEKLKKALPEWLRDKQHVYVLPWKDENGRWQFLDLSYLVPWTMFGDAAKQASQGKVSDLIKTTGLLTGPLPDMVTAIRSNKDAFTGRDIANAGDPTALQIGSWLTWLYNLAMPPVLTNRGLIGPDLGDPTHNFGGRIHQALTGSQNKYGEPRATDVQAIMAAVGINMYPINPESSRTSEMQRLHFEIVESQRLLMLKMKDRGLSEESKQKLIDTYKAEMLKRYEKLKKFADESQIPEALR